MNDAAPRGPPPAPGRSGSRSDRRASRSSRRSCDEHVGEIDAVEVLHHEVGAALLGRAEVGDVDDVRVADARRRPRLAPEALDQVLLRRVREVQDLDRDDLADLDVLAGVDRPHAPLADLAQDAVAAVDDPPREVDRQRCRRRDGNGSGCLRGPAPPAGPAPRAGGSGWSRHSPDLTGPTGVTDSAGLADRRQRRGRPLGRLAARWAARAGHDAAAAVLDGSCGALRQELLPLLRALRGWCCRRGSRTNSATRSASARGAISAITSDSAWRISSADWIAVLAIGRQRPQQHDLVQRRGDPGRPRRRRDQLGVAHQRQRGRRIQARQLQELLPGQQLPQHDAQACRRRCARRPSRRAPARAPGTAARPNTTPGRGVLLLEHAAGQAEVGQLHVADVAQQDVGRGHVPVDQLQVAVAVHVGQRAGHLAHHVQGHVQRDALAGAHAAVPDLAQVLALDQLHGDVELAVDLARVEGGDQGRVRRAAAPPWPRRGTGWPWPGRPSR